MVRTPSKTRANRYRSYCEQVDCSSDLPNPVNPFKHTRVTLELTLEAFAALCGVSKQAIIRQEQGVPDKPIDKVAEYLVQKHGYDYLPLINGYEEFQILTRQRNRRLFGRWDGLTFYPMHEEHPLLRLLTSAWEYPSVGSEPGEPVGRMNPTELAKLLCINQAIIDHFLNKVHRQHSVPKPLLNALRQNGYTIKELTLFEDAYTAYRQFTIKGVEPEVVEEESESLKSQILKELNV